MSRSDRVWDRIPDEVRSRIIDSALEATELLPRESAVRFTDTQAYFVSETSVYRLLKAHDLITSQALIVIKRQTSSHQDDSANQLWQTEFTYLMVIG